MMIHASHQILNIENNRSNVIHPILRYICLFIVKLGKDITEVVT